MRLQCFNVQMDFWLCLASFQVSGQNTETLLDAPLNTERPFCCRDSGLSACSLKFYGSAIRAGLSAVRYSARLVVGASPIHSHQILENKSQLQSGFKLEFYAPKVVSGVELNESKLPRGRYYVPEIRACRTRKSIQRAGTADRNDVEAQMNRASGVSSRAGVAMTLKAATTVSRKARHRAMGLQDDRSPLTTATWMQSVEPKRIPYCAEWCNKKHHFLAYGSGVFPAVVLLSESGAIN